MLDKRCCRRRCLCREKVPCLCGLKSGKKKERSERDEYRKRRSPRREHDKRCQFHQFQRLMGFLVSRHSRIHTCRSFFCVLFRPLPFFVQSQFFITLFLPAFGQAYSSFGSGRKTSENGIYFFPFSFCKCKPKKKLGDNTNYVTELRKVRRKTPRTAPLHYYV